MKPLRRREFVKYSLGGLAGVAVGSQLPWSPFFAGQAQAQSNIKLDLLVSIDIDLPPAVAARLGRDKLRMWIIENNDPDRPESAPRRAYPSPTIRFVQGDVVHVQISGKSGTHTIHWHGIEPAPTSDGVGKHSFEVSGNFIYQFQVNEAGTYFYHCHKNTTLHFSMGLWGGLIVDPPNPNIAADNSLGVTFTALAPPYATLGPGYAAGPRSFFGLSPGNAIPYHRERSGRWTPWIPAGT